MVCAECGLTLESPYYFRTPKLCRKCYGQLPSAVQLRIATEYPKAPWELRPTAHGLLRGVGGYLCTVKGASLVFGWASWLTAALGWWTFLAISDSDRGLFSEWQARTLVIDVIWYVMPAALGIAAVAAVISALAKPRSLRRLVGPACLAIVVGVGFLWLWGFASALAIP